jgi:hypothetical protein
MTMRGNYPGDDERELSGEDRCGDSISHYVVRGTICS